ncbi:glycoside hydrolase family 3 C-terminal domain-containing protein [Persicobacter diffluens]|uniref:Beta-glucosidase n=1 Tax=Persicobacter diffluens TaxID=981 RepID=A0AAN5ALF2_9BACT|nr:beta-glucosidase [Persicobacter diffluens]
MKKWLLLFLMWIPAFLGKAQDFQKPDIPFYNHQLSVEERLDDISNRLTNSEKGHMITLWNKGVPRLGLKSFMPGEALHGLAAPRHNAATVFPQSIGLAASWNPDLMKAIGDAVSDEARAQYHNGPVIKKGNEKGKKGPLFFWSPVINIGRDPRWGRNQENYGEDPLLTSQFVSHYLKGLQGDDPNYLKVAAGAKHFVANNEEHNRFNGNADVSEKQLREYYFPAYKAAVQEGDAKIIMTAYNALNGLPCVENSWLVNDVLRKEWGFDGFVIGDYGSELMLTQGWKERGFQGHEKYADNVASAAAVMNAQTLDMGNTRLFRKELMQAIEEGKVDEKELDRAFRNVMRVGLRLGMFDPEELSPWKDLPFETMCADAHKALALKAAEESLVLLQNNPVDGQPILPFQKEKIKKVAIVGPNADALNFGTYSGVAKDPVSVLNGLRQYLGEDIEVVYVPWKKKDQELVDIPMDRIISLDNQGMGVWKARYYTNKQAHGKPIAQNTVANIDHHWNEKAPHAKLKGQDSYSVVYSSTIAPTKSGLYTLGIETAGANVTVKVNGAPLIRTHGDKENVEHLAKAIRFEEGQNYELEVLYMKNANAQLNQLRFGWQLPVDETAYEGGEMELAANVDAVIAVMGLSVEYERESIDRSFEGLPREQVAFLKELLQVNKNTAVVLQNGSSIESEWLKQHAPAILEAWYPGEQGGLAIAKALFGAVNPGGKLPMTFVKSWNDLPGQDDYDIAKGRTYLYFEKEPLFAFGHGLSYTDFEFSPMEINAESFALEDEIVVSFSVRNTGDRSGDEVAQLYVKELFERNEKPIQRLKAFQRVHLGQGEHANVQLSIPVKDLAYWDENDKQWKVGNGPIELRLGNASDKIHLTKTVNIVGGAL